MLDARRPCGLEADELERRLLELVRQVAPALLAEPGVGPISAAAIVLAWSHHGRIRNDADGYYQTMSNEAKAVIVAAQASADATKKAASALDKAGGEAYVKMELAKMLATKKILIVPASNVSTMNVNQMVDYLLGKQTKD